MPTPQASVSHSRLPESSFYLPHFTCSPFPNPSLGTLLPGLRDYRPASFRTVPHKTAQPKDALKEKPDHVIPVPKTGQGLPREPEQMQSPPAPAHLLTSVVSPHFHSPPFIVSFIPIDRLSPSPCLWLWPLSLLCSQGRSSSFYHLHRELLNE